MSKFTANEITTKRLELSTGTTNQTFQFSEVDTTVLSSGIIKEQTYEYTLNFEGDVGMTAEIRLVGKIYTGDNTQWFTVLFVVVEDEIAYTDAINVLPEFVRCFITKSYSSGVTSYKLEVDHQLDTTMYFTAYIDGYSFKNKANTSSVAVEKILFGDRGVFGGGINYPANDTLNTIDYISISTTGNATDFGDLTQARYALAATSDGSRGVFGGGGSSPAVWPYGPLVNTIDYIPIATPGNATDFGDLTQTRYHLAATSDGSRGVFGGGLNYPRVNTIDYIPISTPGNATDFGDLTLARGYLAATSDGSRGVFGGGDPGASFNAIDYIPIATPGNATDFGDLSQTRNSPGATSDGSRGVFGGGGPTHDARNTIDYITISTPGNATDFGDLTQSRQYISATSDGSRGVFGGGSSGFPANGVNTIDYITIATTGNATDFGDVTENKYNLAATSGVI